MTRKLNPINLLFFLILWMPAQHLRAEDITTNPHHYSAHKVGGPFLFNSHVMYVWRLALPVTTGAYKTDFQSNPEKVRAFWARMEKELNELFSPSVGYVFQVIQRDELMNVATEPNFDIYTENTYGAAGKTNMNKIIRREDYDAGIWIVEGKTGISGQAIVGSAYNKNGCTYGYCSNNELHVCHELGHLFGAKHVHSADNGSLEPLFGSSLMSYGIPRDFISLYSVHEIRQRSQSETYPFYWQNPERTIMFNNGYEMNIFQQMTTNVVYGVAVGSDAVKPRLDESVCKPEYRIPKGACFAFKLSGNDPEGYPLKYACQPVKQPDIRRGLMSFRETESGIVDYKPFYRTYDNGVDQFYLADGGDPTTIPAGDYVFWMAAIRQPKHEKTYENFIKYPYYPAMDAYETVLKVVDGASFTASIATPATNNAYEQGQKIVVRWGVNTDYFKAGDSLRITLSEDFGNTFPIVLRTGVPALAGECEVIIPQRAIGQVSFGGTQKKVRGGIIKIEEESGIAYTLTCLSPSDATLTKAEGGFTTVEGLVSFDNAPAHYIVVPDASHLPDVAVVTAITKTGLQVDVSYEQIEESTGVRRIWSAVDNGKTYYLQQLIRYGAVSEPNGSDNGNTPTTAISKPLSVDEPINGKIYNIHGQRVDDDYKGIVIVNGKKVIKR